MAKSLFRGPRRWLRAFASAVLALGAFTFGCTPDEEAENLIPSIQIRVTHVFPQSAGWAQSLFINGAGFGTDTNEVRVLFEQPGKSLEQRPVVLRDDYIQTVVPTTLDTGTTTIKIRRGKNVSQLPYRFRVIGGNGPFIRGVRTPLVEQDDTVTVAGLAFGTSAANLKVRMAGSDGVWREHRIISVSDTLIRFAFSSTPTLGSQQAEVIRLADTSYQFSLFVMTPPVVIESFSPDSSYFPSGMTLTARNLYYPEPFRHTVIFRQGGLEYRMGIQQITNERVARLTAPFALIPRFVDGPMTVTVETFGRSSAPYTFTCRLPRPVLNFIYNDAFVYEESKVEVNASDLLTERTRDIRFRIRKGSQVWWSPEMQGNIPYFWLPYGIEPGDYQLSVFSEDRGSNELPMRVLPARPQPTEQITLSTSGGVRRYTLKGRFLGKTIADNKIVGFDDNDRAHTTRTATITAVRPRTTANGLDELDFEFVMFDFCGRWRYVLQTYGLDTHTYPLGGFEVSPVVTRFSLFNLPYTAKPYLYLYPGDPMEYEGSGFTTTTQAATLSLGTDFGSLFYDSGGVATPLPAQPATLLTPTLMRFPPLPVPVSGAIGDWRIYNKPTGTIAYIGFLGCPGTAQSCVIGPVISNGGGPPPTTPGMPVTIRGLNLGRNAPGFKTYAVIMTNSFVPITEVEATVSADQDAMTFPAPSSGYYYIQVKVEYAPGKFISSRYINMVVVN